ncbi:hypothetical protein V6N11_056634 [Hibiscus sabdariffa]|uniref:Uncharacterized protein n=1 Tax=Hibiscus sabdariffa TaxID=183260 RepID=A0ABR2T5C8_9ROSI
MPYHIFYSCNKAVHGGHFISENLYRGVDHESKVMSKNQAPGNPKLISNKPCRAGRIRAYAHQRSLGPPAMSTFFNANSDGHMNRNRNHQS